METFLESDGVEIKKIIHVCFNRLKGKGAVVLAITLGRSDSNPIWDHLYEMTKDGKDAIHR